MEIAVFHYTGLTLKFECHTPSVWFSQSEDGLHTKLESVGDKRLFKKHSYEWLVNMDLAQSDLDLFSTF